MSGKRDHFKELMDELERPPAESHPVEWSERGGSARGKEEASCSFTLPCADLTCPCRIAPKRGTRN